MSVTENNRSNESAKTVLVGMTGGISSTIAAYLLKKQGFRVIGVSLMFYSSKKVTDEEKQKIQDEAEALEAENKKDKDKNKIKKKEKLEDEEVKIVDEVYGRCQIDNLEKVKSVCDHLEIEFYAVNAQEVFFDKVMENVIAARLSGVDYIPCVDCNIAKIETLISKTVILKADFVATGHYAKVHRDMESGEFQLICANDLNRDQSELLSKLDQQHLSKLLLPLAEMRYTEVEKVAAALKIDLVKRAPDNTLCIMKDSDLGLYVDQHSAPSLHKDGQIQRVDEAVISDHQGVHHFYHGQKDLKIIGSNNTADTNFVVLKVIPGKRLVIAGPPKIKKFKHIYLKNFKTIRDINYSKPLSSFASFCFDAERHPCHIYFKNNNFIIIEFDELITKEIYIGAGLTLFSTFELNAKVLGSGQIHKIGNFDEVTDADLEKDDIMSSFDDDKATDDKKTAAAKKKKEKEEFKF